jgi:hypothetical protein
MAYMNKENTTLKLQTPAWWLTTRGGRKMGQQKVPLLGKQKGPMESPRRGDEENGLTLFDR